MRTDDLIQQLSDETAPVRRLARPWLRALGWLAVGLPAVVLVVCLFEPPANILRALGDPRMMVESLAVFATAVSAAIAAFASEVPGTDRRWLWLPLVPFAVWIATLGQGCVSDYAAMGAAALELKADGCLTPAVLAGIVPAAAIFVMVRRGAPVMPRATLALAALAVGALVNLGVILFHAGDVSIMVLTWHAGTMLVFATALGFAGPSLFGWRGARLPRA